MTKISDTYVYLPDIFTSEELHSSMGKEITKRSINRILSGYVRKGLVARLKNNLYAKASADEFYVASASTGGYIGFSSALYLHGLKTEVEGSVYACVDNIQKKLHFLDTLIIPVHMPTMCYGTVIIGKVAVSNYPKTIFDMLFKPKYANFFDMYRALKYRNMDKKEWSLLLRYAERSNLTTIRRIGYSLEHLSPRWFSRRLFKLNKPSGKSFFYKKLAVNFSEKWLIYDDLNIKRWANAY